jgi:hypothetical protein
MVSFSMFSHRKFGKFSEKQNEGENFQLEKHFFPPKKSLLCIQTRNPNAEQDVNQIVQDIQICMPTDHIDYFIN